MKLRISFTIILATLLSGCGIYNFTGGNVGTAQTYQVNFFDNLATQSPGSVIEPGLDRDFTIALQDMIQNQTSLKLSSDNADLIYEGEITEYRIAPMSATANMTAAQNRLSMSVNVRFTNTTKEDADFERRFSFFFDYPADALLNSVKTEAHQALFERITQDIFNASLADW
jgi:hypothetical protein